jgi:cytochrome c553
MRRALLLVAFAALAACGQRETNAPMARNDPPPGARNNTAAMGAAPASASASAAAPVPPGVARVPALSPQDIDAGRTIAAQGAPGAPACVSCHGANGEGNAPSGFPRLAAQGRIYLEHQLNSFADGTRANPVMTPIAGALSAQQRAQVAGFYANLGTNGAQQQASNTPEPVLVVRGDDKRGLQACANCHGPGGIGDAAANPYLAGQHEQYLASALAAWKDGSRHNDPSGRMPAIAKALSDDEARSLSGYFAKLAPPAPTAASQGAGTNPGQTTR